MSAISFSWSMRRAHTGSVSLAVALCVLLLALLSIIGVGWRLWPAAGRSLPGLYRLLYTGEPAFSSPSPAATPSSDVLLPQFRVDPELASETEELEHALFAPLRAYYATKTDQLGDVLVAPSDRATHTTHVTFVLQHEGRPRSQAFYFDRTGDEHHGPYPTWNPSMLDVTK